MWVSATALEIAFKKRWTFWRSQILPTRTRPSSSCGRRQSWRTLPTLWSATRFLSWSNSTGWDRPSTTRIRRLTTSTDKAAGVPSYWGKWARCPHLTKSAPKRRSWRRWRAASNYRTSSDESARAPEQQRPVRPDLRLIRRSDWCSGGAWETSVAASLRPTCHILSSPCSFSWSRRAPSQSGYFGEDQTWGPWETWETS